LSIIRVAGDSMLPTLGDGDDILVDRGDGQARLRDGVYALRLDGGLVVKRVKLDRAAARAEVVSDNPAYPRRAPEPAAALDVVGRVVWTGRRIA
jgi:phage repressor protein C with HTH and peptisase S24 domain